MVDAAASKVTTVLVTDSLEVAQARSHIEDRLCARQAGLLPIASAATADGEGQIIRVGPVIGGHLLGVPVRVLLGPCFTREGSAAIPIRWEALTFGSLFPVLDGTLLLSDLGGGRSRLGIEASYRVPLDKVGERLDRALFHRVAESTIRSFLERMAGALAGSS